MPGLHRIARTLTLSTLLTTACDAVDDGGEGSRETVVDSDATDAGSMDEEVLTSGSEGDVPGASGPVLDRIGDAVVPVEALRNVCRPVGFKIGDHAAGGDHGGAANGSGTASPARPCPK